MVLVVSEGVRWSHQCDATYVLSVGGDQCRKELFFFVLLYLRRKCSGLPCLCEWSEGEVCERPSAGWSRSVAAAPVQRDYPSASQPHLPPTNPLLHSLTCAGNLFLNLAGKTIHYGEQIFLNCRGRSKGGWKLKLCRASEPPSYAR